MPTRQYIGARYVPKFYENGNNTSDWTPNTIYEPLTIVLYNGNSYTSKKYVPASVSSPDMNADYWAATGNYNAQIGTLENEIQTAQAIVSESPFNVLAYGVKNDGTEDCTDIVNSLLTQGDVYFPIGTYRIDGTLTALHNIYGAGYSRSPEYTNEHCTTLEFTSNVNNIEVPAGNVSIMLNNFNIVRSWDDTSNAIECSTDKYLDIRNIGVFYSAGGIAIHVVNTTNVSRSLYADHLTIWGEFDRGISINKATDSRLTNIEIMFATIGAYIINSAWTFMDAVHIWCGAYKPTSKTNARWITTRGVVLSEGTVLNFGYLYTDTCYQDFQIAGPAKLSGSKLLSWYDNNYSGVATSFDGEVFKLAGTSVTVDVNDITYRTGSFKTGGLSSSSGFGLSYDKVNCYTDLTWNAYRNTYAKPKNEFTYTVNAGADNYQTVAVLFHRYGGYGEFTLSYDNNSVTIKEDPRNTFTKTTHYGSIPVYYKATTNMDGWQIIEFIAPTNPYFIKGNNFTFNSNNYGYYDMGDIFDSATKEKIAMPTYSGTTGFTEALEG